MSTRGAIMRRVNGKLEGRYHHWDSYPSGLGKALYGLYHTMGGNLYQMCVLLLDEHPAGWSTIVGKDFGLTPGYVQYPEITQIEKRQPLCYCHGDRSEPGYLWQETDLPADLEYVYTFDEGSVMVIMDAHLKELARVPLRDPEPDWAALDKLE